MVQTFEKIDRRCVAVVVDPIQSVKGNVVIDAFRLYPGGGGIMMMVNATKPLQSTGNRGHISKSTSQQKQRGCGRVLPSSRPLERGPRHPVGGL